MRKVLKIIGWLLGILFTLVIILVLLLQTNFAKEFIRKKAVAFLQNKLKTEVQIGKINYALPKMLSLEGVFVRDAAGDTLLHAGKLKVDMNMLKLINSKVEVQQIVLEDIYANLYRNQTDSNFSYQFIIDAFAGSPDTTAVAQTEKAPADTTGGLSFALDKLQLRNIRVRYHDVSGGLLTDVQLRDLDLRVNALNPMRNQYDIQQLTVNGLTCALVADSVYLPADTTSSESSPLFLKAAHLVLKDIHFSYTDRLSNMLTQASFDELSIDPKTIDLEKQFIAVQKLYCGNSKVLIHMGKPTAPIPEKPQEDTSSSSANWRIFANELHLAKANFTFDDDSKPRQPKGLDYAHMQITDCDLLVNETYYSPDTIFGSLKNLVVKERCGLDVQEMRADFLYHSKGAVLRNFYARTPQTLIQDQMAVSYPSLQAISSNPGSMEIALNLVNSQVGVKDILLFAPDLAKQELFARNANSIFKFETVASGTMAKLDIRKLYLKGLKQTEIFMSGQLRGLPDADKLEYQLLIPQLRSGSEDLALFIPKEQQQSFRLPQSFSISGTVAGTTTRYAPNLKLVSTEGNATINGYLSLEPKNRESYDLTVRTLNLNLGRILRQDSLMGSVTGLIKVKGNGFDPKTMRANLDGQIASVRLQQYTYRGLTLNGKINSGNADIHFVSADPNARMQLDAQAAFTSTYPALSGTFNIDSVDLYALKYYAEPFKIRSNITFDVQEANPDYPHGTVVLRTTDILLGANKYYMDSMFIAARSSQDSGQNIILSANSLYAAVTGHLPLTKAGDAAMAHVEKHWNGADTSKYQLPANYDLKLETHVWQTPMLTAIVPALNLPDSLQLTASLDNAGMNVLLDIPGVSYSGTQVQNAQLNITEDASQLQYTFNADYIAQSSMRFNQPSLNGTVQNNTVTASAGLTDSVGQPQFALNTALRLSRDTLLVSLTNPLMLHYDNWQVNPSNQVALRGSDLMIRNFEISHNDQLLKVNSEPYAPNAPLVASIRKLDIGRIMSMVSADTLLLTGLLNADAKVADFNTQPKIEATLNLNNLAVYGDTLGNLTAEAHNPDNNTYAAKLNLDGNGNKLDVTGNYYLQPVAGNNFDFHVLLGSLNIASLEGLASGNIVNSKGNITGDILVKGTTDAPVIRGSLETRELSTRPVMLGSLLRMPDEKILFTSDGIVMDNFDIYDSLNNKGTLSGKILTQNYRDYEMDLRFKADDWHIVDAPSGRKKLFYGSLVMSSNLHVTGPLTSPDVDGSLGIDKGTDLTVVLPESNPGVEDRKGVVEFVDMDDTSRYKLLTAAPAADSNKINVRAGSEINVNVNIDKEAILSMIIDQSTGDFLRVQGEANLNTNITAGGTLGLTGTYELQDGMYQFNYNMVKRKFKIQKGSKLIFAGDPLDADADITAIYEADAPPYDLVQNQVDPSTLNYYKQRLPFEVHLIMKGVIMKPELTFDIVLPENKRYRMNSDAVTVVQGKLRELRNNPSDLNKQVFALLILNRFISETPFTSGGTDVAYAARQSVSRFLSEQLNQFAGSIIKGFDVNFDLESEDDYTTGTAQSRTDLNVEVSKQLFNDRLTVTVGNNFDLEGTPGGSSGSTNAIPGNLAIDYKLTPDGRYMVRGYRQGENTGVIDGYVVETGVNFIITFDYNRFRQLFKKAKKEPKETKANSKNDPS
jgi:hypothetical protein